MRVEGLPGGLSGPITLGFRAEDAAIVPADGQIAAPVYSIELLGEASMISYRIGDALVSVKAPKEYRAEIGQTSSTPPSPPPSATCSTRAAASGSGPATPQRHAPTRQATARTGTSRDDLNISSAASPTPTGPRTTPRSAPPSRRS